jgi:hypothetical protein
MFNILHKLEKKSIAQLQFWIVLLSICIASQVQYIQHGWINPDSTLYLEAAKFFSNGNWQSGFDVFGWPFYSLCIALLNTITRLGVHVSAQILNVIFFGISTYSFIKIIQLAGGQQKQIIAGALIWLSAQYMIGGVLEMLMRDEGFWAFFLLSIMFFLRFYQQHRLKDALLWQVCIIVATLFRIEAILYLMFLPLTLLFQAGLTIKQKCKNLLIANAINISLAMIIMAVFILNDSLSTKILGRLNEVFTANLWQQFIGHLNKKSLIMSDQVLGEFLNEFAVPGLLLTFLYVICVRIISSTGIIIVGLSVFAIKKRGHLFNQQAFQVLSGVAIIALANMGLIIVKVFVLSGRYVLAFSFILMVFSAFYFAELLFKNNQSNKAKWLSIALILFMLGSAVKNILPKKPGYNYQQEAVAWLSAYNKANKPVFYEDARLRYFAGAPFVGVGTFNWELLAAESKNNGTENFDYLVINQSVQHPEKEGLVSKKLSQYHELNRFSSAKAKKSIIIYQKNDEFSQ